MVLKAEMTRFEQKNWASMLLLSKLAKEGGNPIMGIGRKHEPKLVVKSESDGD